MSSASEEKSTLTVTNPQLSESPEADSECTYCVLELLRVLR